MNIAIETIEGWYCFNDLRKIDWQKWKKLSVKERGDILDEICTLFQQWSRVEESMEGSHAIYQILGHKADIMIMILRPTLEELMQIEVAFNKTRFADFTIQTTSYISVVELSNYLPKGEDPYSKPEIRTRLYPMLPKTDYISFYPMNKRREGNDNWYMLSQEDRTHMMKSHSLIGRQYSGKVKQIILGSVGFDDYEWGVALFTNNPLHFKKLVYEMRFDEVSARYGDFGVFTIGKRISNENLGQILQL